MVFQLIAHELYKTISSNDNICELLPYFEDHCLDGF